VTRQPNAIDFWRGFALITIFINHIPGLYFERFTHRNFSFSDSADLFVFLAGWALGLSIGGPEGAASTGRILTRLGGRVITIYAAQLLLSSLAIAMLAGAATYFERPILLSWFNVAAIFNDPINAHLGLAMLTYQLGYFDILPLYVVLMIAAPLIVLIYRLAPSALLPVSLTIYLWALIFEMSPPTWPTEGTWFFNPLTWQFVFVLGFLFAGEEGLGGFVRRHQHRLMLVAAPVLLAATLMVVFKWWPGAGDVPEPKLLFTVEKSYMTPIRLIQFLSLVVVFADVYPHIARPLPTLSEFFSLLGRNSLSVFCVASLLSVGFQILRFIYIPGISMDTAILISGLAILGFTAWVSEWRASRSSARSAQMGADAGQLALPLVGRADAQPSRRD